jgi:hypothetical protein
MPNNAKQTVALSRIKRACDGAIKEAKNVDRVGGITGTQLQQIETLSLEIAAAVAVLALEIGR